MILFCICVLLWWHVFRERARRASATGSDSVSGSNSILIRTELQGRINLAEQEIEHYGAQVEELQREEQALDNKIWWYESHGLPCSVLKEDKRKVSQKLWTTQHKVAKAKLTKMSVERKMHNA